jgi:hypothetical protein
MIAAEAEAAGRSAAESASAHRPPECKQAERERYEFWMREILKYSITYLQGKMADESPPPQALPAQVAELLGNVMRFYGGIIHLQLRALRATPIHAQVAQHARRTRSFMMRCMQVFLTIAS